MLFNVKQKICLALNKIRNQLYIYFIFTNFVASFISSLMVGKDICARSCV